MKRDKEAQERVEAQIRAQAKMKEISHSIYGEGVGEVMKQEETYRKPDGEEVDPEYMRDWSGWQEEAKQDELTPEEIEDEKHAKLKGYDNVVLWYLACINAEINILLEPTLRTDNRLLSLALQAKKYIVKIEAQLAKCKSHRLDRPELREKIFDLVTDPPCRNCDFWDVQGHYCWLKNMHPNSKKCELMNQILALFDEEEIRKQERERIINLLQDLLEMSEKNKDPNAIPVRLSQVLQALKENKCV